MFLSLLASAYFFFCGKILFVTDFYPRGTCFVGSHYWASETVGESCGQPHAEVMVAVKPCGLLSEVPFQILEKNWSDVHAILVCLVAEKVRVKKKKKKKT